MNRIEKIVCIWTLLYIVTYLPFLILYGYATLSMMGILSLHFIGIGSLVSTYVLCMRDIYLRKFPDPNHKVTWTLIVVLGSVFGLAAYLTRHGMKQRSNGDP